MSTTTDGAKSSRAAALAGAIGIGGPAVTLIGIVLTQVGAAPMIGFGLFQLGILFGLVAIVAGGIGLYTTRGGVPGRQKAWLGLVLGVGMVVIVAISAAPGADVPPINDITTNLTDPPGFEPAPEGHLNAGRDMLYPRDFSEQVRTAYPDLKPITVKLSRDDAYQRSLDVARDLGWEVTREDAASGAFEAEDTTALFSFVDDISVRVRSATGDRATIDVRSKSRDGRGDLGTNAVRIREFAAAVAGGS
jgi:uncharacterized protein (DUF1499 family)